MCVHEGLAIAAFGVLGGGRIRTDAEEERRRASGENGRTIMGPQWERTAEERAVCAVLERIAREVGTESVTAVAIAYVLRKAPYVFPIVGGRKVEHLMANVEALKVSLTEEHVKAIEEAKPFVKGYPWDITVRSCFARCFCLWCRADAGAFRVTMALCLSSLRRRPRLTLSLCLRRSSTLEATEYA